MLPRRAPARRILRPGPSPGIVQQDTDSRARRGSNGIYRMYLPASQRQHDHQHASLRRFGRQRVLGQLAGAPERLAAFAAADRLGPVAGQYDRAHTQSPRARARRRPGKDRRVLLAATWFHPLQSACSARLEYLSGLVEGPSAQYQKPAPRTDGYHASRPTPGSRRGRHRPGGSCL
jgi:hypothetical protein